MHCNVCSVLLTSTDFLSTCSINYWKTGIETSEYNYGLAYFSQQFLLHVGWSSVIKRINIMSSRWTDSSITVRWPSLSLVIVFALKSILSDINIATSAFLWLVCYIYIFDPFTFNLFVSLKSVFLQAAKKLGLAF